MDASLDAQLDALLEEESGKSLYVPLKERRRRARSQVSELRGRIREEAERARREEEGSSEEESEAEGGAAEEEGKEEDLFGLDKAAPQRPDESLLDHAARLRKANEGERGGRGRAATLRG